MYGYVYLTTNLINGKKYIGKHKHGTFPDTNYLGSGIHFNNAIKKYGKENFEVSLLCECHSKEDLNEKEKYFIKLYNAVESDEFYNHSYGGESEGWGYGEENIACTLHAREINSKFHLGRKLQPHVYDNLVRIIRNPSKETREKFSKASKSRWQDDSFREHMSRVHSGLKHTEDAKNKIRQKKSWKTHDA